MRPREESSTNNAHHRSVQQHQHTLRFIGNSSVEEKGERQKALLSNMWLMSCRSFPTRSARLQCERQSRKIWPGSIMKQDGGFPASPPHFLTACVETLDLNKISSRSANQNVWPPEPKLGHYRASACSWVWLGCPSSTMPHLAHHWIMTAIFPLWRRERDKNNCEQRAMNPVICSVCAGWNSVCLCFYLRGFEGSEHWQTWKVWLLLLLLLSAAATTDLKIILDLWRDKCLVMNAMVLFPLNKVQMPLAYEDVLILFWRCSLILPKPFSKWKICYIWSNVTILLISVVMRVVTQQPILLWSIERRDHGSHESPDCMWHWWKDPPRWVTDLFSQPSLKILWFWDESQHSLGTGEEIRAVFASFGPTWTHSRCEGVSGHFQCYGESWMKRSDGAPDCFETNPPHV